MDQYPYCEDGREALNQSIQWLAALNKKIDDYGMETIEAFIKCGEATEISEEVRKLLL